MRESQRPQILEAGLRVASRSQSSAITLDAVALEAGVTKPGLMYHFPTSSALMAALIDHAAGQVRARIFGLLVSDSASVRDRYRAYIRVAADGQNMRAEWALFCHSAYRAELQEAWAHQLNPCLVLPHDMPLPERARFTTARLAADGLWAAQASGVLTPSSEDMDVIVQQMLDLLDEGK